MHFTKKHSCVVGPHQCMFSHLIHNIKEYERNIQHPGKKRIVVFKNLSLWVTTFILQFLSNYEILKF
jgi:hypothetical protein